MAEPPDIGGGQPWVLLGGFLVPIIILFAFFIGTLHSVNRFPLHDGEHYRPDIRVVGRQWWWQVEYMADTPDHRVVSAMLTRSTN